MRRYEKAPVMSGGMFRGSTMAIVSIRKAISTGQMAVVESVLQEGQRLDVLAGIEYGDSTLWWVIAAASNIGWGLQVPPGTLIRIPSLSDVAAVI